MIKREDIEKIIKAGSRAPSGSNSQPWRFVVKNGVVNVYAEYEKDHPVLNYRNRGTLLAHGALLENIKIAAAELGYEAGMRLFPRGMCELVCEVSFVEVAQKGHSLYSAIVQRTMNRKPYAKTRITEEEKQAIKLIISSTAEVGVQLVEDKARIKDLASAVSVSERVIFENKELHALLFEEIVWTEREERDKKEGLFLKTLELNILQRGALKLLRYWQIARLANVVGFGRMLAKGNADIYATAPIMGIISVPNRDERFVDAGMMMEKLWLKATELGLSFHIITGVAFFWQQMVLGGYEEFSERHKKMISDAYEMIKSVGGVADDDIPVVVFRIGHGGNPSARSSKKEPSTTFEE